MISDQQTILGQDETVLFEERTGYRLEVLCIVNTLLYLSPCHTGPQSHLTSPHLTSQLNVINEANINEVFLT